MKRLIVLAGLAGGLLAGCSENRAQFPSLLPRAIETRDDAEPVHIPAPPAADPALDARLADAARALAATRADFATRLARAQALAGAAGGAAAGSEPWLDAQGALADLDVVRADMSVTVADLERLAIDRAASGAPPYPALEEARQRADAALAETLAAIAAINARLAPG